MIQMKMEPLKEMQMKRTLKILRKLGE